MAKTWMAGVVLLALIAIGCGSNDDAADNGPVKIRMGWGVPEEEVKYVLMKHPEVAPNLGKAYTIEWHQFAGTPLGVQGLAAGTLDCATVGGLSVANGLDKGADIVLLSEMVEERKPNFSTRWMVRKDSGIDKLSDLKGKTVATNAVGGSTDYFQDDYIKQQTGLVAGRDYKKVEVPFGQMVETVLSGRADMGVFPQPFYLQIDATGKVKTMFRLTDGIDPFVQILNGCRGDFVDEHADAMRAFQQDSQRVARWVADPANRSEVVAASAAATQIPAAVLGRYLLTDQDYYRPPDGALNPAALQHEWDFFHARGAFTRELRVSDHVMALG